MIGDVEEPMALYRVDTEAHRYWALDPRSGDWEPDDDEEAQRILFYGPMRLSWGSKDRPGVEGMEVNVEDARKVARALGWPRAVDTRPTKPGAYRGLSPGH